MENKSKDELLHDIDIKLPYDKRRVDSMYVSELYEIFERGIGKDNAISWRGYFAGFLMVVMVIAVIISLIN